MSAESPPPLVPNDEDTFNFQTANILLLEQGAFGLNLLVQIFAGFGTRNCYKSTNVGAAKEIVQRATIDLVVMDPLLKGVDGKGEDGMEFLRWLRRSATEPNRSVPLIMISANGTKSVVARARDLGASHYLVKPVRPAILLERLARIVRESRKFIVADSYVGPDRRFKNEGPPTGVAPRRASDFTGAVGDAHTPNLSQTEIDTMIVNKKVGT